MPGLLCGGVAPFIRPPAQNAGFEALTALVNGLQAFVAIKKIALANIFRLPIKKPADVAVSGLQVVTTSAQGRLVIEPESALCKRHDITRHRAGEQLARAANLVLRVADHFVQLCNPANGTGQCKHSGEQRNGDADGALHDA